MTDNDLNRSTDILAALRGPVTHRADPTGDDATTLDAWATTGRTLPEAADAVQAWGMAAQTVETAGEGWAPYVLPDDVQVALEEAVAEMAAPLVALASQLTLARDAARERAADAEALNGRLVKALARLADNYPSTSWAGSNDALAIARSLLDELEDGKPGQG